MTVTKGICVFLLFNNVEMGETAKVIYFVIINIFFWLFYTIVDIPYVAVATEVFRWSALSVCVRALTAPKEEAMINTGKGAEYHG